MKLLKIFYQPRSLFRTFKSNPSYKPFLWTLLICSLIIGYFYIPHVGALLLSDIPSNQQMYFTHSIDGLLHWILPFFEFIFMMLQVFFISISIYGLLRLFGKSVNFTNIFAVTIASYMIMIVSEIVNLILLYMYSDLAPVNNLNIIGFNVGNYFNNYFVVQLLQNFNVFAIWFIAILSVGTSIIADIKIHKALFISILAWIVYLVVITFISIRMT